MEDASIVQLFFDRNEAALRAVTDKYGRYLKYIAQNILGLPEDAEECFNDTLQNAWTSIPPMKPVNLGTYLGRIARSLSINRLEKNQALKRGGGVVSSVLEELEWCIPGGNEPEKQVLESELLAAVNAFLGEMPKEKRVLFLRRYYFAESVKSLAESTGRSENAISAELSRTRSRLRAKLTEKGF